MSDAQIGSESSTQITRLGAAELARRISDRAISAVEAVDAYIERLQALQPRFNMLTTDRFDSARAEAAAADELRDSDEAIPPLLGVPITVKECFDVEGMPTNLGLTGGEENPVDRDAELVSKFRRAGAIVLAKTNLPQLGLYLESDNPRFGHSLNPWDESRTCGGSSGGEAVVAAVGGSALGIASDLGGSIRTPAHFCGVHSLKPTSPLLSTTGIKFGLPGMTAIPNSPGFLGRTVEDLSLALQVGQENSIPNERRYASRLGDDLNGVRFAAIDGDSFFPVSPALKRIVNESTSHFQSCGAERVHFELPDLEQLMELFIGLLAADGGVAVRRQLAGSRVDDRLQVLSRISLIPGVLRRPAAAALRNRSKAHAALMLEHARKRSTDEYWKLCDKMVEMRSTFLDRWRAAKLDVMLLPTCAVPAFPHGHANELVTATAYSILANVMNLPSGTVAASRIRHGEESTRSLGVEAAFDLAARSENGSAGLPASIQVIGQPYRDRRVLGAMTNLERHFGRFDDSPIRRAKTQWNSPVYPDAMGEAAQLEDGNRRS